MSFHEKKTYTVFISPMVGTSLDGKIINSNGLKFNISLVKPIYRLIDFITELTIIFKNLT